MRGQIFISMFKNDKGLMDVNENFITVNEIIACDTSWTEEIHHDLKSYIKYVHKYNHSTSKFVKVGYMLLKNLVL